MGLLKNKISRYTHQAAVLLGGRAEKTRVSLTSLSVPPKTPDDNSSVTSADTSVGELPSLSQTISLSNLGISRAAEVCPYCNGRNFVKRGTRRNKYQIVQLYLCRQPECGRTFTAQDIKGKKYPLNVVLEGLSIHNLGYNLEQTCVWLQKKFGVRPDASTLAEWYAQYEPLCRFTRLRSYALKMYPPAAMVETVTLAHRQLYRFRYHRGKIKLLLEEYKNRHFGPLKEYLDNVSSETPHQYFQEGERMSEIVSKFNKAEMIVRGKFNFANRLAKLVLQAVADNKLRHEAVQRFFLANDSVTVASEVPVYLRREDVTHMENQLGFKITDDGTIQIKGHKKSEPLPRLLTGHIDLVQVRNGQIHLLDYKPNASKEKPVEQLTWYALAMSRLTGLRLYEFKCAWFDDKEYFEFYPLHVVKKLSSKRRRRVKFKDGTKVEIPKINKLTII